MSKCGKGCMPECEYFTTGGCISPFNCLYKMETSYINTATSQTERGMMIMTDEEMIENLKCVIVDLTEQNNELKSENAELKARLEKAVELPRIIHPNSHEWHIQYQYESGIITYDIRYSEVKAEARLAELKGENR